MDTRSLEKFAQSARRQLTDQVAARLELVLHGDSADLRARAEAVQKLRAEIKATSGEAVIERVAYTWFNRFCALRFMDANRYTPLGIVSPAPGNTQPELLQEAKAGQIDPAFPVDAGRVLGLLGERIPSPDPQQEAYRLLVVAACNYYHGVMPFLFEPIADYTELLMPDDLLSANSVLHALREAMSEDACRDVEVIGWLYQFYISEKKDAVFAALKQGKKIAPSDIPAATQLFTPHWIVRFLVENSLGRLWLLNRPTSFLAEDMPYYIRPEQQETDFVRVATPEELRICDPAVGSGHMLTYAFDLLYAIYEEEGYNPPDIPRLILQKNIYGIEIDERAGALAAFALVMKGRAKDSRFFHRNARPNICVLRPVTFAEGEVEQALWVQSMEANLLDLPLCDALLRDLEAFALVDTIGSLLHPQLTSSQIEVLRARINAADDLFSQNVNERVLSVLAELEYLTGSYHVVVGNPPYMGGTGMTSLLNQFAKTQYPESNSDLFAMFIDRSLTLCVQHGLIAMITMQNWMFLSSFEQLRKRILDQHTILVMAHLGVKAFDSLNSKVVSTTAFVIETCADPNYRGIYLRLVHGNSEAEKEAQLRGCTTFGRVPCSEHYNVAGASDFNKIPGSPIAYWASEAVVSAFETKPSFSRFFETREGLTTGNNDLFLRLWYEVAHQNVSFNMTSQLDAAQTEKRWFPYIKGGDYRKWAGNYEYVVNWFHDGAELRIFTDPITGRVRSHNYNGTYGFRSGLTWTGISNSAFSSRYVPSGFMFDAKGPMAFALATEYLAPGHGFLNSCVTNHLLEMLAPTIDFKLGHVLTLPFDSVLPISISENVTLAVSSSRQDWDSYETSWDFTVLPLLCVEHRHSTLAASYVGLNRHWQAIVLEMQHLEEENNDIFIDAYGLQDELTPDVPLEEITLTCNPHYRYGDDRSKAELEQFLLADTMREFISYAVGCMFGRYSLDKPGLILANQGETLADYLRQVPNPTFVPDKDNVIPILTGDWFPDDAAERFKRFLRVTFGDEHFAENLAFVENAIGRDIRAYFLRDFYDHHLKMYQKRPIYWLFSSPKGSFNALIYMHRYRPDTVSVVLNDYLREFAAKLSARRSHLEQLRISAATPAADKTRALKEIDGIDKMLAELTAYENDILYPLATQQVAIDLDDGVKVNYTKFGKALKKIPGLGA